VTRMKRAVPCPRARGPIAQQAGLLHSPRRASSFGAANLPGLEDTT
jgi:hypothetical protein